MDAQPVPIQPLREVPRTPEHCGQKMQEVVIPYPLGMIKAHICAKCNYQIKTEVK